MTVHLKAEKFYLYKLQLQLYALDYFAVKNFANANFFSCFFLCFLMKAYFYLHSGVDWHNFVYLSNHNFNWFVEELSSLASDNGVGCY